MNIDHAIRCLYVIVGEHRHSSNYLDGLRALQTVEDAADALHRSQQILEMEQAGSFEKGLHQMMLNTAVTRNAVLLAK